MAKFNGNVYRKMTSEEQKELILRVVPILQEIMSKEDWTKMRSDFRELTDTKTDESYWEFVFNNVELKYVPPCSFAKEQDEAYWTVWCGWKGNHDQRIEDATCSNCGYEHYTVYKSLSELSMFCPKCGKKMSIVEEG